MEPLRNHLWSIPIVSLLLALWASGPTASWATGTSQSRPAAPRRAAPPTKPAARMSQDVTMTHPSALSGAGVDSVRAADAKAEPQNPELGAEGRSPLTHDLWSGRIAAPGTSDDAQTSLALKRLIRQVRVLTLNDKNAVPPVAATAESAATPRTPKAATTGTESVEPAPAQPVAATVPDTTSALAPTTQKTLEGLRKNAGRLRDPLEVAELLFLSGRPTDAVPFYEEALRRTRAGDAASGADRAWILFQLGNCLRESDATKAQDAYTRLIAEYPNSPWTEMARASGRLVAWYQSTRPDQLLTPLKP